MMPEVKQDLPFKLFGKTISWPADKEVTFAVSTTHTEQRLCSSSTGEVCNRVDDDDEDVDYHKKPSQSDLTEGDQESRDVVSNQTDCKDWAPSSSSSFDKPETQSADKEPTSHEASKSDEQSEASVSEEKTLKKPDKIIPCPRCNSMETKFCYHNNYNVNQPRHFCKKCQRYWTAGGTMRNVPVGSGRRKSKSSCASPYQHIMVSDSLGAEGIRPYGTVLAFGPEATLCQLPNNVGRTQDRLDPQAKGVNIQPLPTHVPCFQGPPWSLPWDPLQWSSSVPPGTISPSGYPMAFYPTPPYWGCGMPGTWTSPWTSPPPVLPEQAANVVKHSNDGEMLKDTNSSPQMEMCSERRVWIPKTLRMDDQTEAVRSSIWSSLGVKNVNHHAPMSLRSKGDEKRQRFDTSLVLQANPAAFSRSLNFREAV